MKNYFSAIALQLVVLTLSAQTATVNYDYELNRFAENELLPAETTFLITGSAPTSVNLVEVRIFHDHGKSDREPLATSIWKQPFNRVGNEFFVPVNYKLHAGRTYDIQISYYRTIDSMERQELYDQMVTYLDAYLSESFEIKRKKIHLQDSPKQIFKEMNDITRDGLRRYRGTTEGIFERFSDVIRVKLEQIDRRTVEPSQEVVLTDSMGNVVERRMQLPRLIEDFYSLVNSEIRFALNRDISVLVDSRYLEDYPTQSNKGFFGLYVGYGGAIFGGNLNNLDYDGGVFLGAGFPLSTSRIAPKFLRNASLGFGVFLKDMKDREGNTISGPILPRPYYVGLDYKLISFVRINLGAAILERQSSGNNDDGAAVLIRPFIGVSGKINLSLFFDK